MLDIYNFMSSIFTAQIANDIYQYNNKIKFVQFNLKHEYVNKAIRLSNTKQ